MTHTSEPASGQNGDAKGNHRKSMAEKREHGKDLALRGKGLHRRKFLGGMAGALRSRRSSGPGRPSPC